MLDVRKIRQNAQEVRNALKLRSEDLSIDPLLSRDEERRQLLAQVEEKKALRNQKNKQIGIARKNGVSESEMALLMEELRKAGKEIEWLDAQIARLDREMETLLMDLPNLPQPSVPVGTQEQDNMEVRLSGTPRVFVWEPKTHDELRHDLYLMHINEASAISAPVLRGMGARLMDALSRFFIDIFCEIGYDHMLMNALAAAMPADTRLSIADLYEGMILKGSDLPARDCAHIPDAAGGRIDLNHIVFPTQSDEVLQEMVDSIEKALLLLGLPSRTVEVCSGRLDFSAAKGYAIQVWMPSLGRYMQAAVCSDCTDFAARRLNVRFRADAKDKPHTAHTLCGHISLPCVFNAVLENMQNDDGTVAVPSSLIDATGTDCIR